MHEIERSDQALSTGTRQHKVSPAKRLKFWHYCVLSIPFIGLLIPSFYATWFPQILGIPFFYAYQFLWIFVSAGLTGLVYRAVTR